MLFSVQPSGSNSDEDLQKQIIAIVNITTANGADLGGSIATLAKKSWFMREVKPLIM